MLRPSPSFASPTKSWRTIQSSLPDIAGLQADGYRTVFVLAGLQPDAVREEVETFDPSTLLFLRSVTEATIGHTAASRYVVRRERGRAWLGTSAGEQEWSVTSQDGVTVAIPVRDGIPERLPADQAVLHAFLPTHEPTGFGFKLDADVSTYLSRTRVVLDERTARTIEKAAAMIGRLVRDALEEPDAGRLEALLPLSDLRLAPLKRRSFATDLARALSAEPAIRLGEYRLRPQWLNARDFGVLAAAAGLKTVPSSGEGIAGLTDYLFALGAIEATYEELLPGLSVGGISVLGAADVVAYLCRPGAQGISDRGEKIWAVAGTALTLGDAAGLGQPLDGSFVDQVVERTGGRGALRRLVVSMSDADTAVRLLGRDPSVGFSAPNRSPHPASPASADSLRRWRSAEQQVHAALARQGWSLEDVSRQNLGYDLVGTRPEGSPVFVEVKSIVTPGQSILITSNEEATARLQGSAYVIAIVREIAEGLELALLADPVGSLSLARQCRQWVWECQNYPYEPTRVVFSDAT